MKFQAALRKSPISQSTVQRRRRNELGKLGKLQLILFQDPFCQQLRLSLAKKIPKNFSPTRPARHGGSFLGRVTYWSGRDRLQIRTSQKAVQCTRPLCFNHKKCSAKHLGVSENSGTPKSSILIGFSIIFTIHFGVALFFLETPICWSRTSFLLKPQLTRSQHVVAN